MKKWILTFLCIVGIITLTACGSDEVIVETKSGNITKDDLYEEMKKTYGESVLQQLILGKILPEKYEVTDEEVNAKYEEEKRPYGDSFEMVLLQSGMTEESYKNIIKLNLLIEKAATKDVKVTDEDIKEAYEQTYPRAHARHILVEDEKTAKEVIEKLNAGEKFEDLVEEYSTDTASAAKKGDLGWFGPGEMVEEFFDATIALKKDEISEPVKSDFGYHIIQLLDKEDPKLEDVKEEMEHKAKVNYIQQPENSSHISEAIQRELKEAEVKINDKDLKNIMQADSGENNNEDK